MELENMHEKNILAHFVDEGNVVLEPGVLNHQKHILFMIATIR